MSTHHNLDIKPEPEEVLYINETAIADRTLDCINNDQNQPDNIRIYVPLDLNREAILRRLEQIGNCYEDPSEENEFNFSLDVQQIITQLEIYDQVWYVREKDYVFSPEEKHHSQHAKELVEDILDILEEWEENSFAECFPYDEIDELEEEYGIVRQHHP